MTLFVLGVTLFRLHVTPHVTVPVTHAIDNRAMLHRRMRDLQS